MCHNVQKASQGIDPMTHDDDVHPAISVRTNIKPAPLYLTTQPNPMQIWRISSNRISIVLFVTYNIFYIAKWKSGSEKEPGKATISLKCLKLNGVNKFPKNEERTQYKQTWKWLRRLRLSIFRINLSRHFRSAGTIEVLFLCTETRRNGWFPYFWFSYGNPLS